jgi:ABC-type dipeptide/oligopeptide/nickel transport system permease subunit
MTRYILRRLLQTVPVLFGVIATTIGATAGILLGLCAGYTVRGRTRP